HPRDPHTGRRVPADAALRQSRRPGGRMAIPPAAVDGRPQAHPAAHAVAPRGGHAGAAQHAPRTRDARLLPQPPAARADTRGAAGARALPLERGAAPADGGRRGALAGAPGAMIGPAVAVVLVLATAFPATVRANPSAVPSAVRRALRESSVLVLPSECGGVLT